MTQPRQSVIKSLEFINPGPALDAFNPETSQRQERKNQWVTKQAQSRSKKSIYNEGGCLIETGRNLCDCLVETCTGCFYPCDSCLSSKCGQECRVNRKWHYESVDVESGETRNFPLKREVKNDL